MEAAPAGGLTSRSTALSRAPLPALAAILAALLAGSQPLFAWLIGILVWDQCYCRGGVDVWGVGSTVLVWYSAAAVSAGVLVGRRLTHHRELPSFSGYVTTIVPAVLGALLATPVVAALARQATVDGVDHPGIDASLSVPIGAVLGAFAAALALASTSVARGLAASWAWVWLLGLVAALLVALVPTAAAQPLAGIDVWSGQSGGGAQAFGVIARTVAVIGPAAVAGLVGFTSVRRGSRVSAAVLGGAAGPLLVAAAYRTRPEELVGGNAAWAWIAVLALVGGVVGASVGAALANARQSQDGD